MKNKENLEYTRYQLYQIHDKGFKDKELFLNLLVEFVEKLAYLDSKELDKYDLDLRCFYDCLIRILKEIEQKQLQIKGELLKLNTIKRAGQSYYS